MLAISTLGAVAIQRDGRPLTELDTRKVEALLIYLACTRRTHGREVLAEMFWEERTPERALGNLRVALSSLRKYAGDYLTIDRTAVSLAPGAAVWLDAAELEAKLAAGQVEDALDLYHGDFLEGFYVRDCPAFEDWATLERERLRQRVEGALRDQVARDLRSGDYRAGIRRANRLLVMDPLLEGAHRQLMRLLAYDDQRGAALAQYEACRQVLDDELGVEPDEETTRLFQQIQAGDLPAPPAARAASATPAASLAAERAPMPAAPTPAALMPMPPVALPAFLHEGATGPEPPAFVAREQELVRLGRLLDDACDGHGRVAFVTGVPGLGKTALLTEFARRAMEAHPALLAGSGSCNAYSGVGDPYLPFRDILAMLTGDVEARWAAGAISSGYARRLWQALPATVQALLDHGPDLLGAFVNLQALLSRAAAAAPGGAPWLARLAAPPVRQESRPEGLEQGQLFDQVTQTLHSLAEAHPLLLVVDDLQWADRASFSLLFHLGRRLEGSRILIAAAYRPEEVAIGGSDERHPLDKLLNEFKRHFGDVWIDLDRVDEAESRRFVDALLDTEPNRLARAFRQALFQHTAGHPLFTIELLRALQERGDLVHDQDGYWIAGPGLDWQTLPPRVEGVVEERVARLDAESRDLLALAAVEGERFTVQVLARVRGASERQIVHRLARDLDQRHRLVAEDGIESTGGRRLHHYRFQHTLFQQYLYGHLSAMERELLHAEIAGVLEDLHRGRTGEMAVELARHWLQAAEEDRALPYLLEAGDQARAVYAHAEAEGFYRQAVRILRRQGQDELAARTLMKLGLVYTAAFRTGEAQKAYEEAFGLWEPLRTASTLPAGQPPAAILRIAIEQPPTLDPGQVGDDVSAFLAVQLFEGLVRIGEDHNVLPAAALRWEIGQDGTRYLFHLRDSLRWSDGSPLTAADFGYAWVRNLAPATDSPVAHLLYPIRSARAFHEGAVDDPDQVGVAALDERTLEVRLEGPTAYFPYLLAHPVAYPLPREVVGRHGPAWMESEHRVTNGAYQLSVWQPGKRMVLARNPYFRGHAPGNVEQVECSCCSDYSQALDLYAADQVDVVSLFNADPGTEARARAAYGGELVFFPRPSTLYLLFRADRPPFDDPRARRAFVHAVDREALARRAFPDQRLPATGGFVPPGMAGHSPAIGLPYDPDQARRLLADAGYPAGRGFPAITWLHFRSAEGERIVPFLRDAWRRNLALDLNAAGLDWEPFLDRMLNDPAHLTMVGWSADYPDPDCMLRVPFHSRMGTSSAGWQSPRFDALVEQAAQAADHARRMALYREADRLLVAEEVAVMPLSYGCGRLLAKPWVKLPHTLSVQTPLKNVVVERR
jgi:ABC-type oligopeptide transport system substrate-binding subunit/DNA-binding SARP family transcriptional activator